MTEEIDDWEYECKCGRVIDLKTSNFCSKCGEDVRHEKRNKVIEDVAEIELEAFDVISEELEDDDREDLLVQVGKLIQRLKKIKSKLIDNCNHNIIEAGGGAICSICTTDFGWYCEESPDNTCHYSTSSLDSTIGIQLVTGGFHEMDESYDYDPDRCIFCGEPKERK